MLNKSMNLNDERVRDAAKALEDSMDTRELVKFNMSSCRDEEDLAQMEMNVEDFNVSSLNMKVRHHHRTRQSRQHACMSNFSQWPLKELLQKKSH